MNLPRILDHFILEPQAERAYALDLNYCDVTSQGIVYKNIALVEKPNYDLWAQIQKQHKQLVVPVIDFYRLNIPGDSVSSWNIHTDANFADMIALHYLNLPSQCHGGTWLWKHRATQLLAPREPITQTQVDLFNGDRQKLERWENTEQLEMRFNRLVIFEAKLFHSREPRDLTPFYGSDPETGRLVHVFFYNLR